MIKSLATLGLIIFGGIAIYYSVAWNVVPPAGIWIPFAICFGIEIYYLFEMKGKH